ncbi:MAG: tRNA (adenosine(37)-N6)-threonylcarbamoyltransferase complex ATPase subunit type 1 TsaE [Nitrospirota bacterium]
MRLTSSNPHETEEIGFKIGKILKAGDIVGLYGDLGSGKTTMVKGIASALGIDSRDVTSASFTIIAEYKSTPNFYHIDLYRIGKDDDIYNTGIWDCIRDDSISVIEWAEKVKDELKEDIIKITIESKGDRKREISIEGINEEDWDNL